MKRLKATGTIKEEIKRITKKELQQIRGKISNYLESATLSLIGLEKGYSSKYQIDHCNGRNSVLVDAFRTIAIEEVNKIAKGYKPNKKDLIDLKKTFEDEVKNQMKYQITEFAKEKAQDLIKDIYRNIKIDVDQLLKEEFDNINTEDSAF